ncbi:tyrosine-type recombinase/integrase [Myxococcota bacterium]|nr:tyrosine-type recombinase/integrase [Myxococcota bacterium]
MLDHILTRQNIARSLRAGPAHQHVDAYVAWLVARQHTPGSMSLYLHALARYCVWIEESKREVGRDEVANLAAFRAHLDNRGLLYRKRRDGKRKLRGDVSCVGTFVDFFVETGVATPPLREPTVQEKYPLLAEYAAWIGQHGGVRASSQRVYLVVLGRLVEAIGDDPSKYTTRNVRGFVTEECAKFGVDRATTITIAARSYLRFLVATGRIARGMEGALMYPANWGLSSIPRYIEPDDVEKAIAVFDPATKVGARDRAIILLLARLGLRAGEVAALRMADVDWGGGRLAVAGKGRRQHWLPLPQEVGDAMLVYLRDARPKVANEFVFLRVLAPYREIHMEAVAAVAKKAIRVSGVKAPSVGSHVFRHSVATTMLRQGASLAGVGAVLRHRRPDTTAHYAKVDLGMLGELAQPWPEVSPC